jgi:hypothetical protein
MKILNHQLLQVARLHMQEVLLLKEVFKIRTNSRSPSIWR